MTKKSLTPGQRQTLEIIEELGFGLIEGLSIFNGQPCYDHPPRIIQELKLASGPEWRPDCHDVDLTLKKEFENLFIQLGRLGNGVVDIEVHHCAPFRLVLERSHKEFAP
jgi:hypothetical protein